jgi:protein-tyrosine phosphatase
VPARPELRDESPEQFANEHAEDFADGFERRIDFEGCFNFRDLGGYGTVDGRRVRTQWLYRADGPHALSAADVGKLNDLRLATVVDLRTPQEVTERGCYLAVLPDVVEHHLSMIDVLPDAETLPDWIDPGVVAAQYRNMLERGRESIAEALVILADPSAYPAVFHCSAGKDRTGVLAALLLGLLGVPDETIVADYALSAAAMQHLIEYYQRAYPDAGERLTRLAPAMVAAHPDAMTELIAGIRRDYGGFEEYADAIGAGTVPAGIRAALLG